MAKRTKTTKRKKPQYVKAKKRKDESAALVRRALTVFMLLLLFGGIIFGVMQGVHWIGRKLYTENSRFEIQHLVIASDGKLTEDRIREYTGLKEGTNLFAVAFEDVESSMDKVPVVESVYLERKLPNTLIVKVKERVPVARISGRMKRRYPFVTDRYGYVLPPRQSAESLPLIKGFELDLRLGLPVDHPDVETALKIIALSDSSGYLRNYVRIESLDVKYSDFIDMRLQGGIRVRMPRFSLKPKLQKLASLIKIANGQGHRVKEVDLTLDSAKVPVTYY